MKKYLVILILILMPFISAICEEGQIDINSASATELIKIIHVGEKTAPRIIDMRPFENLEGLDDVPYISVGYVEDIKSQGLACVAKEQTTSKEEDEETTNVAEEDEDSKEHKSLEEEMKEIERVNNSIEIENKIIDLSPQTIKSEDYTSKLSSKDYAKYGLVLFCILLAGLFFVRHKGMRKNEFR